MENLEHIWKISTLQRLLNRCSSISVKTSNSEEAGNYNIWRTQISTSDLYSHQFTIYLFHLHVQPEVKPFPMLFFKRISSICSCSILLPTISILSLELLISHSTSPSFPCLCNHLIPPVSYCFILCLIWHLLNPHYCRNSRGGGDGYY